MVGGRDTRAGTQASTGDGLDVGQVSQNRCEEISKMVNATPGQTKPKEAELKEAAKKKKNTRGRLHTVELKRSYFSLLGLLSCSCLNVVIFFHPSFQRVTTSHSL